MLKHGVHYYLPTIILCVYVSFSLWKVALTEVDLHFLLPTTVGHQFSGGTSLICLDSRGARLRIVYR